MRIAIATVQVPFIRGGAEVLARELHRELIARGHEADIVSIPFKWYPPERLLDGMLMARLVDLTEVNGLPIDRVIALKFPAYYVDHPVKVCWILHQHRQAYDLFETPYGDLHQSARGRGVAREIAQWDRALLPQARALYTISRTVTERMERFSGLVAPTLYHPPENHERYRCDGYGDFILYPGRFDGIKRQHLLVEAIALAKRPVRAVFIGPTSGAYADEVRERVARLGLEGRVEIRGLVDEATKLDLYARCLAVYNGVYDEDYGYLTLEAFFASKAVVTHTDSGGPLEFVTDGANGLVTPPEPQALADALDRLAGGDSDAKSLGEAGRETLRALGIHWDHVIECLLR